MEPVCMLVAAGSVALATNLCFSKMAAPTTLRDVLSEDSRLPEDALLVVMAARVRRAAVCQRLAGRRLSLCLKYGRPGRSVRCEMDEARVPRPQQPVAAAFVGRKPDPASARSPVEVDLGSSGLFLFDREIEPVLRFRLVDRGGCGGGQALAKAELPVGAVIWQPLDKELVLRGGGPRSAPLGALEVSVKVSTVRKGALRELVHHDANFSVLHGGAILMGMSPFLLRVCSGVLVEHEQGEAEDDFETPVLQGVA